MPFRFNCENCDVRIKVPDGSEGKKVKCPSCGHAQRVPGEAVTSVAAAAAQPARSAAKQPVAATSATPPKAGKPTSAETPEPKAAPTAKTKREPNRAADSLPPVDAREPDDALAALAAAAGQTASSPPVPPPPQTPHKRSPKRVVDEPIAPAGPAPLVSDVAPEPMVVSNESDQARSVESPQADNPVHDEIEDHEALQAFLAATEAQVQELPSAQEMVASPTTAIETTLSEPAPVTSYIEVPPVDVVDMDTALAGSALADSETAAPEPMPMPDEIASTASPMSASMDALFGTMPKPSPTAASEASVASESSDDAPDGHDDASIATRSISASQVSEAPAGEVRDLFDDFVRKERIEREAEIQAKTSQEVAAMEPAPSGSPASPVPSLKPTTPTRLAVRPATMKQGPAEPSPVVVVKTPPRVMRGGAAAVKATPVVVPQEPVNEPAAPDVASEPDALAIAAAALTARRAPVAIPLSGAAPAVPVTRPVEAAVVDEPIDAEPGEVVPVATSRRIKPPPAYSLLIVLCWALRLLACLSLVSVVKLVLMALDADYKPVDVAIIAPLGVGISAAIWAVGEVARVARDSARNGHR